MLTNKRPQGLLRFFLRMPILLYRARLGRLLGDRFLMLTHLGRKSDLPREVVLEVVHHDLETDAYFIAAGWREKADWFLNIQVNPQVHVMVNRRLFYAQAQISQPPKAAEIFYIYALRHPKAFRELSRMMTGTVMQPTKDDCFNLAQSVPLVMLMPAARSHMDEGENND